MVKTMTQEFPPIVILPIDRDPTNFDPRFGKTQYWVEASSDDALHLWQQFATQAREFCPNDLNKRYEWKSDCSGVGMTIATWHYENNPQEKNPITIGIKWATIENVLVGFYGSDAVIVDWRKIEHFLDLHSPSFHRGLHVDTVNFGPSRMMEDVNRAK
jgi:hypothetical protein